MLAIMYMITFSSYIIFVLKKFFWVVRTHMAHIYSWYLQIWRKFPKLTLTSPVCMLCLVCAYQFWLLIVSLLRSNWKIWTVEIIRKLFFLENRGGGAEKKGVKKSIFVPLRHTLKKMRQLLLSKCHHNGTTIRTHNEWIRYCNLRMMNWNQ